MNTAHKIYNQYPWLNYDENCDVLIIGGGLTGALCLNRLANVGVNAVMLSQKPIGFSSSHCFAISQHSNELMLTEMLKSHSKDTCITFFKQCEQALTDIEQLCDRFECYFARRDSILFANTPQNVDLLHSEYLLRRHNGIEVEFIERADARNNFSFEIAGGILARNQGAEVDDYALCHGLVKESESLGCRIFENTTAVEIKIDNDGYQVFTSYGRSVHTKRIILCLGKSVCNYIDGEAEVKTCFTAVTEPQEHFDGYSSRAIVHDLDRNVTMHTAEDDSIIITGLSCTLVDPESRMGRIIGITRVKERKYSELERILNGMLTGVSNVNVLYRYTGEFIKTEAMFPVVSPLGTFDDILLATPATINGLIYAYLSAGTV